MHTRLWLLTVLVLATAGYLRFLSDVEAVPLRGSLSDVPAQVGEWEQVRSETMSENILANVGVEDYLMRSYQRPGGPPVSVYVGYYEQQSEKDTIHSPKHCLPGAGWRPVDNRVVAFDTPGLNGGHTRAVRYVVQSGPNRQLVLYWYQSRGRNITNEYLAKVWLVVDSMFRKRNDGSLIRLMTPMAASESPEAAQERAVALGQAFLPEVGKLLPD